MRRFTTGAASGTDTRGAELIDHVPEINLKQKIFLYKPLKATAQSNELKIILLFVCSYFLTIVFNYLPESKESF